MADGRPSWLNREVPGQDQVLLPLLGEMLKSYRTANSLTQAELAERLLIDQTYVSKIERGARVIKNVDFLLRVTQLLDISPGQLGLANSQSTETDSPDSPATASQRRWREERRYLNQHRASLAAEAVALYPRQVRVRDVPLIAGEGWLPQEPVRLEEIELTWIDGPQRVAVDGTEPEAFAARPLRVPGRAYDRYTSAIRYLDPPTLFENRPSYRLTDLNWHNGNGQMSFGLANYFDKLDISEAVGHELAAARMKNQHVTWADLPFRTLLSDPFGFRRRAVIPAITTLTLRRRRTHGTATFMLHWRDPAKVATASGLYDVIPAGEFQPSSMAPWDLSNDFDLWRNVVRELSEEVLGTPEHDGSRSAPIEYDGWPLYRDLGRALQERRVSIYCLGVALDALTLAATIMTVLVIDDDVFDDLLADMVTANAEGITVFGEAGQHGIPFTEPNVNRLLTSEPMASPGAGCLALAWRYRGLLLSP
ncbi:helix-turn-helix domain-containing protein [Streptosporangium sp. NPDC006007]|uniref:helix-turn-helix domain-containing protein n=1 Tax=Streptosporangium sp. NPDC006007 TaxID=3154575 RepID=UPI0033BC53B2